MLPCMKYKECLYINVLAFSCFVVLRWVGYIVHTIRKKVIEIVNLFVNACVWMATHSLSFINNHYLPLCRKNKRKERNQREYIWYISNFYHIIFFKPLCFLNREDHIEWSLIANLFLNKFKNDLLNFIFRSYILVCLIHKFSVSRNFVKVQSNHV
jgi:hypothetical protein